MNNEDLYCKNAAKFKNKIEKAAIALSGNKGVLKAVDNESLSGDTKKRYSKATEEASEEASKFKNKDCSIDPSIQAIYARIYGLI